jgi:hypothetical protein
MMEKTETDIEIKEEEGEALPDEEPIRRWRLDYNQNKKKSGKAHLSLRTATNQQSDPIIQFN